ncbi:MAG: hypothetical protein M3448_01450 [Pseudomonadota bacterium]|nr:hypothetical protein [Pseudomonadota bacterium]
MKAFMKPGTKAMKVIAKSAKIGFVTAPSSFTQRAESQMLNSVHTIAAATAIANFMGTG